MFKNVKTYLSKYDLHKLMELYLGDAKKKQIV